MISVPSGGLVPESNPNQSVMNIFGVPKYTINTSQIVSLCSFVVNTLIKGGFQKTKLLDFLVMSVF
jgi:hypothetical protein